VTISPKQELFCWFIGGAAVLELSEHSHTFNVIAATYYYGLALLCIIAFLFWLRFRKRPTPWPTWLKVVANSVLVIVSAALLLYVLGVATWYE
jgi:drug/metabolite transporter (DMT)-like permease